MKKYKRFITYSGLVPGGPKGSNLAPGGTEPLKVYTDVNKLFSPQ